MQEAVNKVAATSGYCFPIAQHCAAGAQLIASTGRVNKRRVGVRTPAGRWPPAGRLQDDQPSSPRGEKQELHAFRRRDFEAQSRLLGPDRRDRADRSSLRYFRRSEPRRPALGAGPLRTRPFAGAASRAEAFPKAQTQMAGPGGSRTGHDATRTNPR